MKFHILAFLLSVLFLRRGTSLQCYVCGLSLETICESSPDVDERFLRTCNESVTHCQTANITIYSASGSTSSHIVLGCSAGVVNGCTITNEGGRTYGKVCQAVCDSDGCNGVAIPPKPTTTTTEYMSTTSNTSSSSASPTNTGTICDGKVCNRPYSYCCKFDQRQRYCCGFNEYFRFRTMATTTEKKTETSSLPSYGWVAAIISPITIVILILVGLPLLVWRQKVTKRRQVERNQATQVRQEMASTGGGNFSPEGSRTYTDFTSEGRRTAAIGFPQQTDIPPNTLYLGLSRMTGLATAEQQDPPPLYLQTSADLPYSLSIDSTAADPDDPPAYSSVDFGSDIGRVSYPPPLAFNRHDDDILPSYSSVVSGNLA